MWKHELEQAKHRSENEEQGNRGVGVEWGEGGGTITGESFLIAVMVSRTIYVDISSFP